MNDPYLVAITNSMANALNPKLLEIPGFTQGDLEKRLELLATAASNCQEEIRQLREGSTVSPEELHAVADTVMEELEGRTLALIQYLEAEEAADEDEIRRWREQWEPWRDAWRKVMSMGPGRAGFMSAVNSVRQIREKVIYCVVGLDRLSDLPDVEMSNVAKNDFGLVLDELARVGGQDSVHYCHDYVAEKGEDKPPKEG